MTANQIKSELKKLSSSEKADSSAWFFKTGKGQYGYGDKFIGVTVPQQRKVAKKFNDLNLEEIKLLLDSQIHEHRLTGLIILCNKYNKSEDKTREEIFNFYLKNLSRVNNWDLVDTSAPYIIGNYLLNKDKRILYKLAKSNDLWEKRISIVSTAFFISNNQFDDTLKISELLLKDEHDLIHKAVGWMLREVGKRDISKLYSFLDKHASYMPRTMLRYSLERVPLSKKTKYMQAKNLTNKNR